MRHNLARYSILSATILLSAYLVLMIIFRSLSPVEILSHITSNTWRLDSASVERRVQYIKGVLDQHRYGTTADSVWDFTVTIYGRNVVRQSLRIDSIDVLDLESLSAYPVPFFEHYDPRMRSTVNVASIVGKKAFVFAGYVDDWPWKLRNQRPQFEEGFCRAFHRRVFLIQVHSSRGMLAVRPRHYITLGHYIEWTQDVRVLDK